QMGASYVYTFPAASGTLALLEGTQIFSGLKSFDTGLLLKNGFTPTTSGYLGIGSGTSGINISLGAGGGGSLIFQSTSYTYTFPAANGTLALTSDLGSYLPLTGGTLTGALSGTSATFSGVTSITSSTASTTTANGALVVTGGVGIGGDVNIAGTTIFGTSASGNSKFYIYGGFSAGLNLLQNYNGSVYTTEEHRASDYSYKIGTTPAFTIASTGAATFSSSVTTGAPSGGTAKPFKIGAAATVSPTSPNRTIEIEIDGTTYYLSAKTTND
ncbi:MAG: hypothetical protein ACOYKI_03315, partial [Sediminibacterium sp.]